MAGDWANVWEHEAPFQQAVGMHAKSSPLPTAVASPWNWNGWGPLLSAIASVIVNNSNKYFKIQLETYLK